MGRRSTGDREGGGALPRPPCHLTAGGVPHPLARRLESAADRHEPRCDAPRARSAPRRRRGALPRPPALAGDGARSGVRGRARAGVQRLARRSLAPARAHVARLGGDPAAESRRRRCGDPQARRQPVVRLRVLAGVGVEDPLRARAVRPRLRRGAGNRLAHRDPQRRGRLPGLSVPARAVPNGARRALARSSARDGREPRLDARDRRPRSVPGPRDRLHGGRDRLGSMDRESSRQGVHRAPSRGAAPAGAPEHYMRRFFYGTQPIEEPTDPNRHRQAVRAVRRREHCDVRVGLAAPRLRPHAVRLRSAVLAGGAPQDHGAERRCASSASTCPHESGAVPSTRSARSTTCHPARTGWCEPENRELGVFNIRGKVHAIPNLCPHQRGPLCKARSRARSTTDRTPTGSSPGSGRARSSPARGTRSSSTSPPAGVSRSRTSGCERTRCA